MGKRRKQKRGRGNTKPTHINPKKEGTTIANTFTQTTYASNLPKCHTGNTPLYTYPNGGTLFIGGWNNGATFNSKTHVIDLTGAEHKYWDVPVPFDETSKKFLPFLTKGYAGWLSLPFPDYGTPKGLGKREQWEGIAETIKDILKAGTDVLVACHGGHGRSGLFVAIVGYLLAVNDNPAWESPVEHIRTVHCDEAVETYAQEKYVYEILGLRISPRHVYDNDPFWYGRGGTTSYVPAGSGTGPSKGPDPFDSNVHVSSFKNCPICHTQSLFVDDYGMCQTCMKTYKDIAPLRDDLTTEDIAHRGAIPHVCDDTRCLGIWTATKCGHTTHNMIVYEGQCEVCANREFEQQENEKHMQDIQIEDTMCVLCGKSSVSTRDFGICFECSSKLVTSHAVTDVHNSITDPYAFIAHTCEDETMCVGIIRGDVCQHVVHNREVFDGMCPKCYAIKNGPSEEWRS